MKTKLLSLLLLAAMLLTGIPVMAVSAAETAPAGEQDYDYYDLYVQDGLKALHTAFDVDDETIRATNDGNGKWLNRVEGGSNAVLGGGYWRTTANGGIGYDLYRGAADDANGTNYVDDPGTNTYGNTTYFQFGASAYAHEDFTVEYVAEYLPIYTRLTGETAVIGSKVVGEAFNFNAAGMTTASGIYGTGTDYYGYLCAFTGARDGKTEAAEQRGTVRWLAASYQSWNNCRPTDPDGNHHYNTTLGIAAGQDIFHKRGGIYAFAVMADENTADGKNEATYTLLHDRAVLRTATVASYSYEKADGSIYTNLDYTVDSTSNFRLSHCLPTDFYVVRMYHKVLNAAEQAQNHAVDVLEYYNLAIDKTAAQNHMDGLALMLGSVGFEKDAALKTATAKALQTKLTDKGYINYNYVTDGLTALFSAQGEHADTVDVANGKWTDIYAGNVISLGLPSAWKQNQDLGFVGFNIYRGQADADGNNYVDQVDTNSYVNANIQLTLGIALLPKGDYTIDYMAEYTPVYTLLTGSTDVIVGKAYDFKTANGITWEGQYYGPHYIGAVDRIGFLSSWTSCRDDNFDGKARGTVRWVAHASVGYSTAMGSSIGIDSVFHKQGGVYAFAIVRDKTEGVNKATFTLYHDAEMFKMATVENSTKVDFTVDDKGEFYLSRALGTNFYTLRIYDRALSAEELLQNAVVDKVNFYGLTLPEGTFEDALALALVNDQIPTPSSFMSAQEIEAARLQFENYFAALSMYVTDGLTAFFSTNEVFGDTVDLAAGTWTDFFGGNVATLKQSTHWALQENGFIGFNLYRGQADADGSNYVDSAVTNNYYNSSNPTRIQFNIALLPQGDYTVDYMAEYKPIYTLLSGTTKDTISDDKIVGEAHDFKVSGVVSWGEQYWNGHAVESLGYLSGWSYCRDNADGTGRSGLRWHVDKTTTGKTNGMGTEFSTEMADFRSRGVAHSFAITRDVNLADGANEATYSIIQDIVALKSYTQNNTSVADFSVADTGSFFLSDDLPTDFFALRIYNRTLTEAELLQNTLADKVLFYGITLPEGTLGDVEKMVIANGRIPAPSSSMSAQDIAAIRVKMEELLDPTLLDNYVTDGMTAFFSTNGIFADNVDLANGTWTDLYAGKVATLKGSTWKMLDNGFLGFNLYRGQANADGTNYVDDAATNYYYWATNNTTARLELGLALLPKADFTIDYTAEYKPIYTLLTGTTADNITDDKIVGEAFDFVPDGTWKDELYGGGSRTAVDYIGYLSGWTAARDGKNAYGNSRGGLRYGVQNSASYSNCTSVKHGLDLWSSADYRPRGVAYSYAFTRDENTENGNNSAVYQIIQNNVVLRTSTGANADVDFTVDDKGYFYLSDWVPTDFFALRIYDRALTEAELLQNTLVDKALFYGIELPEGTLGDAEKMATVNAKIPAISSSMDETQKAALVIQIKCQLADDPLSLYVTDGLTAFFSAQGVYASTVDLAKGTWTDLYAGKTATLAGAAWKQDSQRGFVGFDLYHGQADADGSNYVDDVATNNYNTAGQNLNLGLSLLPKDDFTVEYTAEYKPIYTLNSDGSGEVVGEAYTYYANGTVSEWPNQMWSGTRNAVDSMGYLTTWTQFRDATIVGASASYVRGALRIVIMTSAGYGSAFTSGNYVSIWDAGTALGTEPFYKRGGAYTFTYTRDEFTDTDEVYKASYSLYQNGTQWRASHVSTNADFTVDDKGSFYLSERLPTDFYTVRIYNRALTSNELLKNAAADRLVHYGIELSEEILANTDALPYIYETIAPFPLVKDLAEWSSTKLAIESAIEARYEEFVTAEGHYVRDGLVALYTAFADKSDLDLAAGTWQNKVHFSGYGAATIGSTAKWTERDMGFGFSQSASEWQAVDKNYPNTGIKLPDEFAQLEDFTVETMGLAESYLNDDGSRYVATKELYFYKSSTFRFGLLYGTMFHTLITSGGLGVRWQLWHKGFQGGAPTAGQGINIGDEQGWRGTTEKPGSTSTPTPYIPVIMHVTKAEDTANVSYNIYYDGEATANKSSTVTKADYDVYNAVAMSGYNGTYPGIFSLYANMPATVYAIRVYNRTLTNAEMRQNRAADIINYYEVTIPEEALASEEALALFYEYCNTTVTAFDYGKVARDAKRLVLEDFVKTVTVKVGENEEELSVLGGKYTLPSAWNGSAAIAWNVDGVSYTPGMTVTVADGSVLQPTVAVLPVLNDGVSVKLTNAADGAAMRFTATVMLATYNAIETLYGATSDITYGMLITPDVYVKGADGVFTRDALRAFVEANNGDVTKSFVEVHSTGFYAVNGEILTLAGSLYKFSSVTHAKNPAFAAVPFIDVDINRDGVVDFTIYGKYNAANSRKVKDTFGAAALSGGFTDEQLGWINATLAPFN